MEKIRYTDDTDRSYGAAGMAISLVIYDADELLAGISLDAAPDDTVELTPEFYFSGNPGISAKSAWNQMVKNYNIGIAMLMSNLLCRHMVNRRTALPPEMREMLHTLACDEGRESCSLDADEIDRLFDKNYNYLNRVFSHRGVQTVAHDFASYLLSRRTLSRLDALEQLQALKML